MATAKKTTVKKSTTKAEKKSATKKAVRAVKTPAAKKAVRAAKKPVAKKAVQAVKKPVAKKAVRAVKKPVAKKAVRAAKKPPTKAATKAVKKSVAKTAVLAKGSRASSQKPIELYYWPTPNGWKVSIMLEECRLPYVIKPVNIGAGDQFKSAFLAISPNNRMPAIIDPQGPGRKRISVFESGAILQYLGRKTGKFYPQTERARVTVEEWLYWQIGGLGPMAGQAHHFRQYAPKKSAYGIARYTDEVNRLYGVMDKRLKRRDFLADKYSIADIACWGWVVPYKLQGQNLDRFPNVKKWLERVGNRPAVQAGFEAGKNLRTAGLGDKTKSGAKARRILFNQRAR